MNIRTRFVPIFLAASLLFALPPLARAATQEHALDRIVAVVNDSVILESELDRAMQMAQRNFQQAGRSMPPQRILRKRALQSLVMHKLQLEMAHRSGIHVSQSRVNAAIHDIAQRNHMNMQQFKQALQDNDMVFSEFRKHIHDELLTRKLRQKKMRDLVHVSDREIDYYLQNQATQGKTRNVYHLSQILISIPQEASPKQIKAAREKTQGILDQIRKGASFARLAAQYSDGQKSADGGDLGWIKSAAIPTFFASVVPQLHTGEVSDVIRSDSGFHLVRLDGVRGSSKKLIIQYKARHILLKSSQVRSPQATKQQIQNLYQRLEKGADFAQLARTYSDDDNSANQGGELGWHARPDFPPSFRAVLDKLQPGQISKPFHTGAGWNIVALQNKRKRDLSQEILRRQARDAIRQRKVKEQYQNYLRKLRSQAYVKYISGGPNGAAS